MRIKERMTAVTVAAMALVVLASTQVSGVASADESYGEYSVGGRILDAYKATGGNAKWGDPTRDEARAKDNGRFQTFENDVSFYWKASVSGGVAHPVSGKIFAKWAQLKWEQGVLGYPTGDPAAAGPGSKQFFQGGNVYTGASTGTHTVWGGILGKYAAAKGPGGKLGLPVGDEYRIGRSYGQDFENGKLVWP